MQHAGNELPRTHQPVEKVVVGPLGSPREPENKAKTLRKRSVLAPEPGAEESVKEFFNRLGPTTKLGE
jgi:hypothetical protein